ncbi:MAG: hypothetical protein QXU92_02810 [Candidatus Diapherotrites archaeon]
MNNLLWVFIFAFLVYIFFPKDKIKYFLLFSILIWAILDMTSLTGLAFTGAQLLLIYYITKIVVLSFFDTPLLRKYMPLASAIHGYGVVLIFTFLVMQ